MAGKTSVVYRSFRSYGMGNFAVMQHIFLAVITMSVVWYAWLNFKKLGRIRAADVELDEAERQRLQMSYITRIALCLIGLAILPFLFTIVTKTS